MEGSDCCETSPVRVSGVPPPGGRHVGSSPLGQKIFVPLESSFFSVLSSFPGQTSAKFPLLGLSSCADNYASHLTPHNEGLLMAIQPGPWVKIIIPTCRGRNWKPGGVKCCVQAIGLGQKCKRGKGQECKKCKRQTHPHTCKRDPCEPQTFGIMENTYLVSRRPHCITNCLLILLSGLLFTHL